ncbi:MAG: FdhF/YdeP family oxidoreductase [Lentisphaeraceae bacterium]|nr:FdhF/YdeP family oxidoreductase [Lentisphaeraceae bacterium]
MSTESPKNFAGGWGALKSSMKFLKREGFVKGNKALLKMNQQTGFDCPGCAWPDPKKPSKIAEYCENGVKALTYESTHKRASIATFMKHTVTEMNTWDDFTLEDQGRLTEPFVYNPETDKYDAISWDAAFKLVADELKALDNPDEAVFYTSGRTTNEAAFMYQLMIRMYGTNNFPDCSNLCHESSGVGMAETVGIGKGTVQIDDFEEAEAIFVMGQNPGTNHPRMLAELQTAARNGCKIVSFNPLKEAGLLNFLHPQDFGKMLSNTKTKISSHYYQPRIGGDLAAMRGMIKYILEQEEAKGGILDKEFIEKHTSEFPEFEAKVKSEDWDFLVNQSGLTKEQIVEAAEIYINSKATIICWAMGLTQHKHGVANIQEVISLLLLKGNIGRPGAGACPVRGHSNVQGDRTVGITENPTEEFLSNLDKAFNMKSPRKHGYSAVHAIKAMAAGEAKVFFAMGGNFASATPDTELTFEGLRKCNLTVHVSTHLNRSHVVHGKKALILPCLGRSELDMQNGVRQKVTVEDSMSMVHASSGSSLPASKALLSETAISCGLGKALFPEALEWDKYVANYDLIRDKMEQVMPAFKGYNEKIKQPGGFHLRNSAAVREWNTSTKKARFISNDVPDLPTDNGRIRLMTVRSHDQYNTTIYDYNDRYRGIKGERMIIFMNKNDISSLGLKEGDKLKLTSHAEDGKKRTAEGFKVVPYDIPEGCSSAYFPETNVLVGIDEMAKKSHTPMSKFIEITVDKM